jgi:uncharacterized protein (DUF1778 family)
MEHVTQMADSKGRVVLPGFANATVIIEAISDTEYRIRKVIPDDALRFSEETMPIPLSARAAARFLEALEHPPRPNAAARRAAKRFRKGY